MVRKRGDIAPSQEAVPAPSADPAASPPAVPATPPVQVPTASPAPVLTPSPSASSAPALAPSPSAHGPSLAPQLLLLFFFLAGVLLSYFELIPKLPNDWNLSFYALCILLFLVGLGVGNDTKTLRQFRTMDRRLLWLPLTTALGTFAAVSLVGWITTLTVPDSLAVGSGFAYYSLSSILITEYKGAYLGTIALLANVFRELITLLGTPWLLRGFGPLAPIASGGATTMDTTLPVIVKYCGPSYTLLAVYHAMVLDFSVPFLVTFFCRF